MAADVIPPAWPPSCMDRVRKACSASDTSRLMRTGRKSGSTHHNAERQAGISLYLTVKRPIPLQSQDSSGGNISDIAQTYSPSFVEECLRAFGWPVLAKSSNNVQGSCPYLNGKPLPPACAGTPCLPARPSRHNPVASRLRSRRCWHLIRPGHGKLMPLTARRPGSEEALTT